MKKGKGRVLAFYLQPESIKALDYLQKKINDGRSRSWIIRKALLSLVDTMKKEETAAA